MNFFFLIFSSSDFVGFDCEILILVYFVSDGMFCLKVWPQSIINIKVPYFSGNGTKWFCEQSNFTAPINLLCL